MNVMIRFSYETDGGVHSGGIYFDDIQPIPRFANEIVLSSNITDTLYLIQGRPNGIYYYTGRARDAENQWSNYSNMEQVLIDQQVSIDESQTTPPGDFAMADNYPNPFNSNTTIMFTTSVPGVVGVKVYDLSGRVVRTFGGEQLDSGVHRIVWDARNEAGVEVASGIYFFKIDTPNRSITRRMTLIR